MSSIVMKYMLCISILSLFLHQPTPRKFQLQGKAQGTTWSILYYAPDSLISPASIATILNQIDSSLSLYQPYSLINAFNASTSGIQVDEHFSIVMRKAIQTCKDTKGAFDITVQPLVKAWGFGVTPVDNTPDAAQIRSLLRCTGSRYLALKNNFAGKKKACITIDANGIAQGYSVDVLADYLESKNIHDYVVEIGGEIRVKGKKPSGEKMRIGIESPADADAPFPIMQKIIPLDHGAITTSGSYRKYHESNGKRITHLIDPATGYPVDNELISVTVYAKDAITADAYDNALMVMGLKKAMAFVERRPYLAAHFIYTDAEGNIADTATSRFPPPLP